MIRLAALWVTGWFRKPPPSRRRFMDAVGKAHLDHGATVRYVDQLYRWQRAAGQWR